METNRRNRTFADRVRDTVLAVLLVAMAAQMLPVAFAAWDKTKPATNGALVSADIRANWTSLEAAFGNLDTVPLTQVATNFSGAIQAQSLTAAQFFAAPTYKPGTDSSLDATISGALQGSVDTTQHANSTTVETTFSSYTLPANVLSANGKMVRVHCWGTIAATGNTKTLKIKFGSTVLTIMSALTINGDVWYASATIIRTGATTQKAFGYRIGQVVSGGQVQAVSANPTETLSGTINIVTTGQSGTASSDIVQEGFYVEVIG